MSIANKSSRNKSCRIPQILVYACILITSIVFSSCQNPSGKVPAKSLVVPGRAIGGITLESDAMGTMNALGKPDAADASMGKAVATWYEQHDPTKNALSIFTARDMGNTAVALIKQIRVTNPDYRTQEGIGASSLLVDIQKVFTLRQENGYSLKGGQVAVYSDSSGIAFEINEKRMCIGIVVFPKGSLHPDTYARFIPGMSSIKTNNL